MDCKFSFCICFSGITIRFQFPTELVVPECYTALQCRDDGHADVEYRVELLTTPLRPMTEPVYQRGDATIYPTEKGWLRIYSALTAADGCQVACLLCPDGKNVLYYPASRWEHYRQYWHSNHLLGGEAVLLQQNAFLLHSSVVAVNGKTILFCGPSGAGKSTQAALWEKFAGADILNGDRCVVMKKEDGFYGGGSPWSGTSGIYRGEQAPIAGIVLLKKGPQERLRRMGIEAFAPLFSQTTVNSWDSRFVERVSGLYAQMLEQVPVYELECRPCVEAVELVYRELFGQGQL